MYPNKLNKTTFGSNNFYVHVVMHKETHFWNKIMIFFTPIMTNLMKTICLNLQADFGNPNTHPHNKNKTKTVFYASPEDFTFF